MSPVVEDKEGTLPITVALWFNRFGRKKQTRASFVSCYLSVAFCFLRLFLTHRVVAISCRETYLSCVVCRTTPTSLKCSELIECKRLRLLKLKQDSLKKSQAVSAFISEGLKQQHSRLTNEQELR